MDVLVTVAEFITTAPVTQSTVRTWVSRYGITPHGTAPSGEILYREIDLLKAEQKTRRKERWRKMLTDFSKFETLNATG